MSTVQVVHFLSKTCCMLLLYIRIIYMTLCTYIVPCPKRVLDFGCGPCIHTVISASSKCDSIVCAEYTESNRKEIEKWLVEDEDAFDWKMVLQNVTSLEGKRYCEL